MNHMKRLPARKAFPCWIFPLLAVPLLLAGCGGGEEHPTAAVTGKVTYKGDPVQGGTLIFAPVAESDKSNPGKPGIANIKDDGTFTVSTYAQEDGAVVGKNNLTFTPPIPEAPATPEGGHSQETPKSPYDGLVPKPSSVDVKSGETNSFNIELAPSGS